MSNITKLNGYQLWLSSQYWQRSFNQLLKSSEITHAQYMVLSYMVWADKKEKLSKLSQNQLAHELCLDAMMISNVLKALETKKWITRMSADKAKKIATKSVTKITTDDKSGSDKKEKTPTLTGNILSVTDEGKSLVKELATQVAEFEEKVFHKVNKKFRKGLESIVEQLSE